MPTVHLPRGRNFSFQHSFTELVDTHNFSQVLSIPLILPNFGGQLASHLATRVKEIFAIGTDKGI